MLYDLKQVAFGYRQTRILEEVTLDLEPGFFYGIIGPNGSGKTTLVDLLVNLKKPTGGRIRFNDRLLASYRPKALARHIALVPQNFYINFPFTAEEVVMMGRYPHIPRFAAPTLEDYQAVDAVMKETQTGGLRRRFVTQLSGGEKQRVVFARALAQDTPVLVLDEATSNMDIRHSLSVLNLVLTTVRQQGKTVIAVFQDLNLAAGYCDYLIFMQKGRVVVSGPTGEVLDQDTIGRVFQVQAKVYHEAYSNRRQVVFKY